MSVHGERPRELRWYHAGAMLFGDWGTSRLYVLGLCYFYVGDASLWLVAAMSLLLIAVGWAYQVICRLHPDGGGVYSSARERSPLLGMIGGLLLCADYVVTAALSALDAFHYLNLPHEALWAAGSILLLGIVNAFGPKHSGRGALVIALLTVTITLIIAAAAMPFYPQIRVSRIEGGFGHWWMQFTAIILAISGVEAVANMTGIMQQPVPQTSKRAIIPVVCEIVLLNLLLVLAVQAMPLDVLGAGDPALARTAHRDDMLRVMAEHYVGPWFAAGASLVFASLLLSAVNTSVVDLVSIQFMMARDGELPRRLSRLNDWGVPTTPLVIAAAIPALVVLAVPDVGHLADLYAIGVVGAVAVNLATTSTNPANELGRFERRGMQLLAVLLSAIWITIAYEKPWALGFAASFVSIGLAARWCVQHRDWFAARWRTWVAEPAATTVAVLPSFPRMHRRPRAATGPGRIMVSTQGNLSLLEFAVEEAASRGAELMVLFVRLAAVLPMGRALRPALEQDPQAQQMFATVQQMAEQARVKCIPLYAVTNDVPDAILDLAVTHGVDTLVLGSTRRGALWRAMKGDVIQKVAEFLPESIRLLIHA